MATAPTGHPLPINVSHATLADLDALTPLFDAYRGFYRQASDPDGARRFLHARFEHDESEIFLARNATEGDALGFTQLYPLFSSVSMRRIWVLNDLFVLPEARKRGVARALMCAAREFGHVNGAIWLTLETANDNGPAQALYESLGYHSETGVRHYSLLLD